MYEAVMASVVVIVCQYCDEGETEGQLPYWQSKYAVPDEMIVFVT